MRLLIVGGAGFVGGHLAARARDGGHEVVTSSRRPGVADTVCDPLDPDAVARLVTEAGPTHVVDLDGLSSVSACWAAPARALRLNAEGPAVLVEAIATAAPGAHLILVSSGEVYGRLADDQLPAREDAPTRPLNPYGATKLAMEQLTGTLVARHGIACAVMRAFNHTGPGQRDDFAAPAFARQIADAERRGDTEVVLRHGDLTPLRDFSDVRDVAGAYLLAAARRLTGTSNVSSGRAVPIASLIDCLDAATQLTVTRAPDPDRMRPAEIPALAGDPRRLTERTGWEPRIPLARTMADLLDSWREAPGTG